MACSIVKKQIKWKRAGAQINSLDTLLLEIIQKTLNTTLSELKYSLSILCWQ